MASIAVPVVAAAGAAVASLGALAGSALATLAGFAGVAATAVGGILAAVSAPALGVIAVIGAVAGGVYLLVRNLGAIRATAQGAFDAVGLGFAWLGQSARQAGASAWASLSWAFGRIAAAAQTAFGGLTMAFQGVVDAMTAGDLAIAGQGAMAGLKVAFASAKNILLEIWSSLIAALETMWAKFVASARSALAGLTGELARYNYAFFHRDDYEKKHELQNKPSEAKQAATEAYKRGNLVEMQRLDTESARLYR